MSYGNHGNLTFGLISDEWSREVADDGAPGRDDILHRLLQAVWRGEFDSHGKSLLTIVLPGCALEPGVVAGEALNLDNATVITRSGLVRVLELKGILPALPTSRDGSVEETFAALTELAPDKFGDLVRNAYLEALIVSRDDFGAWCDECDIERPSFWFAAEDVSEG